MRRLASPNLFLPVLTVVCALLYLGYSLYYGFVGFPLDDGWIHQTYARNLGVFHQLAYNLGEPSVGSTSPLWTLLLSPAYALRLDPRLWTYVLGAILLALTAWLLQRLSRLLFPKSRLLPLVTSGFCLLEWHLAWAAFSGMETMLFVFLSLLVLERHLAGKGPLLTGLVAGLLTLTRPEGVIMLVLLIGDTVRHSARGAGRSTLRSCGTLVALILLGFILPVAPYLALNLSITGNPFPNTFYAKQAEYRELATSLPIWARWARVASATVIGAQILLIPGFIYAAYEGVASRSRRILFPLAWWFALITLYACRLPVTYQHGRYVIPTIPVLVLLGLWGTENLPRLHRIPRRVLRISIPVLLLIFWLRGAEQYATDVRIIDSELAAAGVWIRDNTPSTAVIGAHDIGAIGYISGRSLVDTAGLITPEVIPFMRDEDRILAFLQTRGVDYIAIFPSWYPTIASDTRLRPIYRSTGPWVVEAGGDNIVVYETGWRGFK
jgi:hypothetical protein